MWIRIQEVKEPDLKPVPVPDVKDVFEVFKQILFIFDHMHLDLDRAWCCSLVPDPHYNARGSEKMIVTCIISIVMFTVYQTSFLVTKLTFLFSSQAFHVLLPGHHIKVIIHCPEKKSESLHEHRACHVPERMQRYLSGFCLHMQVPCPVTRNTVQYSVYRCISSRPDRLGFYAKDSD